MASPKVTYPIANGVLATYERIPALARSVFVTCRSLQSGAPPVPTAVANPGSTPARAALKMAVEVLPSPRTTTSMVRLGGMPQDVKLGLVAKMRGSSHTCAKVLGRLCWGGVFALRPIPIAASCLPNEATNHLTISGAQMRAAVLRHPCILGGPETKGDKIRIGCLTHRGRDRKWPKKLSCARPVR